MSAAIFVVDTPLSHERAALLAARLSLPLFEFMPPDVGYVAALQFCDDHLQLLPADAKQSGPVCVDFCGGANAYRLQGGAELIVKAVRGRSKETLRVLDATAGLGRDSFVLASRGLHVQMLERSPIIAALLADGLERAHHCGDARLEEIVGNMLLQQMDASTYLAELTPEQHPDVIYLDPMFPASDKSALVKKEMRLFQQLFHGADDNYDELLDLSRQRARLRVVVKRPRKSEPLANARPDYALEGKSVRFDVYVSAPDQPVPTP
ncbi:MAG: class I SAM-dependent methyltransferase [Spongiibacteraceae bacterium]